MTPSDTEAAIVDLQIRIAYQEDTLNALSDIVARQQQQIERLIARLERLDDRMSTLPTSESSEPDPPPPHY